MLPRTVLVAGIVLGSCWGWGEEPPGKAFSDTIKRVHALSHSDEVVWPTQRRTDSPGTALGVLSASVQAKDKNTRLRALEGLLETSPNESVAVFLAALSDPEPEVQALAARGLLKCEPQCVLDRILSIVSGSDPVALPGVDAALPELKEGFEEAFLTILDSKTELPWRKNGAAYILGRMESVPAIPLLAKGVWSEDLVTRVTCFNALLAINDPLVIPQLKALSVHPKQEVRDTVVQRLADLGGPEAYAVLGEIAATPPRDDIGVSRKATLVLGASKDKSVIPLLINALEKNTASKHPIIDALRKVTNEDFGDEAAAWQQWYWRSQGIEPPVQDAVEDPPILSPPHEEPRKETKKTTKPSKNKGTVTAPDESDTSERTTKKDADAGMKGEENKSSSSGKENEQAEKSRKGMRRFIEKLIPKSHKEEPVKPKRYEFTIN